MRLFLVILLAGVTSIATGIGAIAAVATWLPSHDDAAGRGLGQVFMIGFVVLYAVIAMPVLGLAARGGESGLRRAALVLAAIPAAIVLFAVLQALTIRADAYELEKQFFSALTILLPLEAIVAVQRTVLRSYLRARMGLPIFTGATR